MSFTFSLFFVFVIAPHDIHDNFTDLNHISASDEVMNGKSGGQVWPVVSPPGRYISYD